MEKINKAKLIVKSSLINRNEGPRPKTERSTIKKANTANRSENVEFIPE